jgi:hypothetical protein
MRFLKNFFKKLFGKKQPPIQTEFKKELSNTQEIEDNDIKDIVTNKYKIYIDENMANEIVKLLGNLNVK